MCFRPAEVSGPKKCPGCGKIIPVIPNMPFPETCKGCGADLSSIAPGGASAGTPSAPGAPAPRTPGAPQAPGAPRQ
ncbi:MULTISPECIES: hypothetical protein [unclassified Adlercreutzia]|uniref:hypothetical protein n=1 Tax=unclassified Adlercreutzia TaxID=2636013 RepID=UPI0013EB2EAB|nr:MULTISPECIES: hypothetical protein [unclassified Adlercreutzia]